MSLSIFYHLMRIRKWMLNLIVILCTLLISLNSFAVKNSPQDESASDSRAANKFGAGLSVNAPNATRPDGNYPNYRLNDRAILRLTTNPVQAEQPVFAWRVKDGVVQRNGDEIGETNSQGVFEVDVTLEATDLCGQYSGEQFSVGAVSNPRSASLSYKIICPAPDADRNDSHFPNYEIGDVAQLEIRTSPVMANAPVFSWRRKNGSVERNGEEIGRTNASGVFINSLTIDDPDACGSYTNEQFAVGNIINDRSTSMSYTVTCPTPVAQRNDNNYPNYDLGDFARVTVSTTPALPNEPVYTWRYKDGQLQRNGEHLGYTNSQGVFVNELYLTDPDVCGQYSGEKFAVGSRSNPRSSSLSYTVTCPPPGRPVATRPDGHYPDYQLGQTAQLRVVTNPKQPEEPVYTWRLKDGQVQRNAEYLGDTDANGIFVNTLVLEDPDVCGEYSGEQFAVGSTNGLRSTALSYRITCPQAPHVERTDTNFPNYVIGQTATLRLTTNPIQSNEDVFGWRFKDGQLERNGDFVGKTNAAGIFENTLVLEDPSICGSYSGEQFSVGSSTGPRSNSLTYTISCDVPEAPVATRPDEFFPTYRLGNTAQLKITTDPVQANQNIYSWRLKDGEVERDGVVIGKTNSNGIFENSGVLTSPELCGAYTDETFAVGSINNPRSASLNYDILCSDLLISFTDVDAAVPDTFYTSNTIVLAGLDSPVNVSIQGGANSTLIKNDNVVGSSAQVDNGDTLAIRSRSATGTGMQTITMTLNGAQTSWNIKSAVLPTLPPVSGSRFGYTPAEFSVDATGSANYKVPLIVSPGVQGIQPLLSLNYTSQVSSGLLGIGWNLSGLSGISRCAATQAQDGFVDGVDFDGNDRFCLDGQRLIAISGVYGEDGTEYRTERETFSRIISYGVAGNGPAYFKVWYQSGEIVEYGGNANSDVGRIEASGRADIFSWAMSKLSDRSGNYLTVEYFENSKDGEYYPTRINYTGNEVAGTLPFAHVAFNYQSRVDRRVRFVSGSPVTISKRLATIQSYFGNSIVREYRLQYVNTQTKESNFDDSDFNRNMVETNDLEAMNIETSALEKNGLQLDRTYLESITECGNNGQCHEPINLTWQDPGDGSYDSFQGLLTEIGGSAERAFLDSSRIKFADFNGDGQSDIYQVIGWDTSQAPSPDPDNVYLSNSDGSYHRVDGLVTRIGDTVSGAQLDIDRLKFGDFNGDGRTDIYQINGWGNNAIDKVYFAQEDGTFGTPVNAINTYISNDVSEARVDLSRIKLGDFNGDGRTDLYYVRGGWGSPGSFTDYVYYSLGNTGQTRADLFANPVTGPSTIVNSGRERASVDLSRIIPGDFNGDGLADIYYVNGWGNYFTNDWLHLNTGNTTFTRVNGISTKVRSNVSQANVDLARLKFGDFNGDGNLDIYYVDGWRNDNLSTRDYIHLSKGDGQFHRILGLNTSVNNSSTQGAGVDIARIKLFHFNADSKTDLYRVRGWGNYQVDTIYLTLGNGQFVTKDGLNTFVSNDLGRARYDVSTLKHGDFSGDGKTDIYKVNGWGNTRRDFIYSQDFQLPLIKSITNADGFNFDIEYSPLTNDAIYAKGQGAVYPKANIQPSTYVVSRYLTPNGIGGNFENAFQYKDGQYDFSRKQFLGFSEVTETRSGEQKTIKNQYSHDYRLSDMPVKTFHYVGNDILVERVDNTLDINSLGGNGHYFSYISRSESRQYELDSSLYRHVIRTSIYDDFGHQIDTTVDWNDGNKERVQTSFDNNVNAWLLSQMKGQSTTAESNFSSPQTRTMAYDYDDYGRLITETVQPDHANLKLINQFTLDDFGNRTKVTISGNGIVSRSQEITYDSYGRFQTGRKNSLGHSETLSHEPLLGKLSQQTDANLLTTRYSYDAFGRVVLQTSPSGEQVRTSYFKCDLTCPGDAVYFIREDGSGKASKVDYFDRLGRVIRNQVSGFDGNAIYVDTQFNGQGEKYRISEPHFAGSSAIFTVFNYDALQRITTQTAPGNRVTRHQYQGLETTITNAKNQTAKRVVDARGRLVTSYDDSNKALTYQYDGFGNVIQSSDPENNRITMRYDIRGNKTQITEGDTGTTNYTYNGLGEMLTQQDAKQQWVRSSYDKLGRVSRVISPEGTTIYQYDTAAFGVGQLDYVRGPNGNKESYHYDSFGRLSEVIRQIDNESFPSSRTHNRAGHVDSYTYPTGFAVRHAYNADGYQTKLTSKDKSHTYWQAKRVNARGQIEQVSLGNGINTTKSYRSDTGWLESIQSTGALKFGKKLSSSVQSLSYRYDSLGNMEYRADATQGVSESFIYDNLNRLTRATVSGQSAIVVNYDDIGNITYKSDVGNYTYDSQRPHAVVRAGNRYFSYDANGNRISHASDLSSGSFGSVVFSSFNKARRISNNGSLVEFEYGPLNHRVKKTDTQAAQTKTTIYVEGRYERETSGNEVKHIHFIQQGSETIAIYTESNNAQSGIESNTKYLHKDHLGSIESVTDEAGTLLERLSFDAWGKRRQSNWKPSEKVSSIITRGFTGHEQLDTVKLIHMNGRLYDAEIGRFVSADPQVKTPEDLQSLNRYSYVNNNPLSYTDPSGYFLSGVKSFLKKWWRPIVAIVLTVVTYGAMSSVAAAWAAGAGFTGTAASVAAGVIQGAVAGFVGGAVMGGSLEAALKGAVSGALFGGISGYYQKVYSFGRALAEGTASGISSEMDGGKFIDGFKTVFVQGMLKAAAIKMRKIMIAQSKLNPLNATGISVGFMGDGFKLGGGRWDWKRFFKAPTSRNFGQMRSVLGGMQGGTGKFLFFDYKPGSIWDRIVEAFAGPHDYLNQFFGYDAMGNVNAARGPLFRAFGGFMNGINVVVATPFVVSSVLPANMTPLLMQTYQQSRK
ncbi:RHS repeat-associated core domain-containing protein [Aliikangiella coralliicola]|uniref:Uncharacterized protein n=1 Tax=Aliikangiella coralliicola TaxID=2592383 RepID=A0A545U0I7_9GAMM|nr:FG-GAP-like repeat-containing protein [Aliikangiella coralliicola]TQV82933.1 hypothetical protein FLL46_24495 [Aliikangiella coralliicola]